MRHIGSLSYDIARILADRAFMAKPTGTMPRDAPVGRQTTRLVPRTGECRPPHLISSHSHCSYFHYPCIGCPQLPALRNVHACPRDSRNTIVCSRYGYSGLAGIRDLIRIDSNRIRSSRRIRVRYIIALLAKEDQGTSSQREWCITVTRISNMEG